MKPCNIRRNAHFPSKMASPSAAACIFTHEVASPSAAADIFTHRVAPKREALHFQRAQAYKNHPMAIQAFPEASPERADLSPKRELETPAAACSRSLQESAAACSRSLQESPTCRLGPKPELEPKPQLAASAPSANLHSSPLGWSVAPPLEGWLEGGRPKP